MPFPFFGKKVTLEDELINLKLTSKQMIRASKKCTKNEKAAVEKLKQAIKQGNVEGARIYGQNAIREKNQSLNFLKLSSRIDAVASRVETAVRMGSLTGTMKGVVKGMDVGLASMDVEKISQVMDKFEQQFEDLDVKSSYMDDAMDSTTATSTPADQVDELVKMVADQNNLDLGEAFSDLSVGAKVPELKQPEKPATDDLEARLANLRS
eukprot:CAMPEP_0178965792 /NCGR_PEP_ID=MMETSP0789-20121207/16534_1 /TAXON_ID=3005 /ORGANISM="Rhizosolenia setigera, Strain CCMP 1694" /LENGTH=208 /DNA_ID=CAMNT_0020650927 /DNA_START=90 /DNA_END=716 /DNA_ORIENTATION=+